MMNLKFLLFSGLLVVSLPINTNAMESAYFSPFKTPGGILQLNKDTRNVAVNINGWTFYKAHLTTRTDGVVFEFDTLWVETGSIDVPYRKATNKEIDEVNDYLNKNSRLLGETEWYPQYPPINYEDLTGEKAHMQEPFQQLPSGEFSFSTNEFFTNEKASSAYQTINNQKSTTPKKDLLADIKDDEINIPLHLSISTNKNNELKAEILLLNKCLCCDTCHQQELDYLFRKFPLAYDTLTCIAHDGKLGKLKAQRVLQRMLSFYSSEGIIDFFFGSQCAAETKK